MKLNKLLAITLTVTMMSMLIGGWSATFAKTKATSKDTGSKDYSLIWSDNFTGKTLDKTKWNYELHDPGWVNNELQSYTNSSDNIYVKDGNLVIQPIKTEDKVTGKVTYTSGRINTKNKVDIKYGKVEVRAKLPMGQGIWPAIWMMPTNEDIYGSWPKCGEIDIMELLGNNPTKIYQTLHYGKSSSDVQSQTTKTLSNGDFSSDYHLFSVEWDPGKISFYVDGQLTKTFTKWFTGTDGVGIITYPAPFDQNFYMILNVAVGGNWPGNPDQTTNFTKAKMMVDYVKVYQKASYNENVTMENDSSITLRNPDANGNYINNSDFSNEEALNDSTNWYLQTAMGGDAAGTISDHTMTITTKNVGTVDYAIQAMQAGIPLEKGGHYSISFDAKADVDRSMILRLDGPNYNYLKYMKDQTVGLTTTYQTYTYDFNMSEDTDDNGRIEFNLGAQNSKNPTATVQIKNVKLIKTGQDEIKDVKTVLADGNYVYNGTFDQGINRLGYWKVSSNKVNANIFVTNSDCIRMLKAIVPSSSKKQSDVIVSQPGLALKADTSYILSFDAKSSKEKGIQVTIAGKDYKPNLTTKIKSYKYTLTTASDLKDNSAVLQFLLGKEGTVSIDNVRIEKVQSNSSEMVKNGDFSDGIANWAPYVDSGASATYNVENKNIKFNITNPGSQNWHVQLKQSGLKLEKGKTYQLKVTFKSNVDRKVEVALMGNADKNYAYYGGEVIALVAGKENNYVAKYTMNSDSDPNSDLVFSLGSVGDGTTPAGNVEISGVSLEEVE